MKKDPGAARMISNSNEPDMLCRRTWAECDTAAGASTRGIAKISNKVMNVSVYVNNSFVIIDFFASRKSSL